VTKRKTRKQKENIHHPFLVSWQPQEARVNRESNSKIYVAKSKPELTKRADLLALDEQTKITKKGVLRSLVVTSLILILEVVVYLALK